MYSCILYSAVERCMTVKLWGGLGPMRVTCIRFIQHEWPMPIGHWIRSESFAARAAVQRPLAAASASTAAAARTERPTEHAAGRAVLRFIQQS